MNIPLPQIAPVNGALTLSDDVLGDVAYVAVANALDLSTDAVLTGCTMPVAPTANLLTLEGMLPSLLGQGPATVRLYLFEVATLLGQTERHAILLFTTIPGALTAGKLVEQFCANGETGAMPTELGALSTLTFRDSYLLFSSLDYGGAYQDPPFPPRSDTGAPQAFLSAIQPDLTAGYMFTATARLQSSVTLTPVEGDTDTLDLSAALTALGLGALCTDGVDVTGQIAMPWTGTTLKLLHKLSPAVSPGASFPLSPSLSRMGIGIPLGSGKVQIPLLELGGTLTLAGAPSQVQMSFDPAANELAVSFSQLPDFAELAARFGSGTLESALGGFLPADALADLGTVEILQLGLSIDCDALYVDTLTLSVTTENPLALFDGITMQPALIASFVDPFESYRGVNVQVVGKWFLGSSALDTILSVERDAISADDQTLFMATLSLGSGVDFVELAGALFHDQVAGLPTLVVSDIEVTAQRSGSGDTASESVSLELDVASGWRLDGTETALDDLSLDISFAKESAAANWTLQSASAQGTLDIGPAFFNLSADYDANNQSWTFSGGSAPEETVNLGRFLGSVATALGLDAPGDFLAPFSTVNVTGCYLQYQSNSSGSPTWQLMLSTDFVGGSFGGIDLDGIVINFNRVGTATSLSFDATAPTPHTQSVVKLIHYLATTFGLNVELPGCLTASDVTLVGLSASHDAATESSNFVAYLNFAASAMVQLHIDIYTQTLHGQTTKAYDLDGNLIFNPGADDEFIFVLELVKSGGASDLVASFHADSGTGITLNQLVQAIDSSATGLDTFQIDIKDALFAHSGVGSAAKSLFAVDMGAAVSLSGLANLPLIGAELASAGSLDLAFQVVYATGSYSTEELDAINQALGNPTFRFPTPPPAARTIALATSLRLGGEQVIDLSLPVSPNASGGLSSNGSSTVSSSSGSSQTTAGGGGITWFPVGKAFGPLSLDRVGLSFSAPDMTVTGYLDGGISVGPITFDLLGLDVSVPLTGASRFDPSFGLQGLGLQYQNGPVDIGGALIKMDRGGTVEFDGFVTVRTEQLEIGALASFAKMNDGNDSLFVYAVLGEPLGGPAFFFVTGLAAGFGYNRKLLPPPLSGVQSFPLVTEAMNPSPRPQAGDLTGIRDYVASQLALMEQDIAPSAGETFLAAGIQFTSFELINGFLLAIVQFGNEFRVDLLGLANALLPPDDSADPLAEIQLAILAHYVPSEGSILAQGTLTPNSYVLSRDCHLTGGFALASWVSGPNSGQFVVSIGGYNPRFQPPSYYPSPAPVTFNWQVNGNLNVKGGGYFALVPHVMMAGGTYQAVWQSGPVRAWFVMAADFIIAWKPFHYTADIQVDLGCELTIHFFGTHHVSVGAGADLSVWGPEFGGRARITVRVIGIHFHFGISFGASPTPPPALTWDQFSHAFLPTDPGRWLGVSMQGGLIRTVTGTLPNGGGSVEIWIVKRDQLSIATNAALPVLQVEFSLDGQSASTPAISETGLGVAPMDVAQIDTSTHRISITNLYGTGGSASELLKLVPISKKVPSGLWGQTFTRPLNTDPGRDVLASVCGFSIVPSQTAKEDPNAITVARASLAYETTTKPGFTWTANTGVFTGTEQSWANVGAVINETASTRAQLIDALGFEDFHENFNQPLWQDAPTKPQLGTLGS